VFNVRIRLAAADSLAAMRAHQVRNRDGSNDQDDGYDDEQLD
jgi:hypothetical protein